jgi:hypothetical protein
MEVLKYNWITKKFTIAKDSSCLLRGVFIWVFHWDKIPHLGISVDGKYFSSTIRGAQKNEHVEIYHRLVISKQIPTFCIQVEACISRNILNENFSSALIENETCLLPIKTVLGYNDENIQTLSDLIRRLKLDQRLTRILTLLPAQSLSLNQYSKSDVLQYITKQKKNAVGKR